MNRNLHSLPDHAAPDQVRHPGSRGKRPQASDLTDLDSYVDAFETAILQSGLESKSIDYRQYLPDVTSPIYLDVAGEVVRIDLETRWSRGEHVTVESYRPHVTELFADTDSLSELLFEEYRQRYLAGTPVPRHQYAERYGISTSSWPDYDTVARSADKTKHGPVTRPDGSERNERSTNSLRFAAATIEQLGRMPEIGESLNGFQLVDVLGEGAFARVYLARQSQLGNRRVALKVSTSPSVEADRLAILQHTNIVPIYSSGRSAGWDLVCMPYLGSVTLRDLLHDLQAAASRGESLSGQSVRECIDAREHPSQREIYADSYRHLDRRTYTDAILWIIAKISDGLTRAHELGIVHGDLKPANILLASDGEPRILDFNLSQFNATEVPTRALVGGTLPYMSPQQLQATLVGGDLTPQDDVYSLGVIAYELLTLKPPFPRHEGEFEVVAHQMMDDRRQVPPMVYRVPQGTLGSVRTIVSKCLTPPPAGRYATALPLAEDLHRQLRNERLRHTPGETLRDRANKWVRRHPRVTSAGTVTLAAALVVGLLVAGMVRQARVVAQQSATESFHVFQDEQKTARAMLAISGLDPGTIQNAIATAENALLRIHVSKDGVQSSSIERYLDAKTARQFKHQVAELYSMMAMRHAELRRLIPDASAEHLSRARQLNAQAIELWDGSIPVSFAAQRDWLNQAGSEEMSTVADWSDVVTLPNILTAPDGDRESDRLLMTILFIEAGRYREAQDELRVLLGVHPDDPSLWILQGHSWAGLGELSLADECYSMSTALAPNIAFAWFQRGRGRMDQGRYAEASNDFTRACELQPSFMEAWLNHAICLRKTNRHSDAELVLTHAIELPDVREIPVRAYFLRSDSRAKTGDEQGALADREYALSITPTDEHSWIARGNALVAQDAKAALACFDQALQLNPHSTQAAQNALYVLIEELQQLDVAKIRLLSLVHTRPRDAMARATLSVVLARMGERDGALEQVDALLSLKPTPRQTYQAASALAITGRSHRSDFERAIQLVATAFRLEPELVSLAERDPDMAALRGNPEYHQMVGAVRTLQSK